MRHLPSDCEKKFWWCVRDRRFNGYKFKRQVLIGRYIVDFLCVEKKLIVELDGGQHVERKGYDAKRDLFLKSKGYRVIRFWNSEFIENPDGVLATVLREVESAPSPRPSPPAGERG